MERVWPARLKWRMRGAWLWPTFVVLTALEGVLLNELPISGDGPGGWLPGALLAGFANLFFIAAVAPIGARPLRRRRPDLPRTVAVDRAGTTLLVAFAMALVVGGLIHRPQVLAEREDRAATADAVYQYVISQAPEYQHALGLADTVRLGEDVYRTCLPGEQARRWLCLVVETDQRPAGVTRDSDEIPNSDYRRQ